MKSITVPRATSSTLRFGDSSKRVVSSGWYTSRLCQVCPSAAFSPSLAGATTLLNRYDATSRSGTKLRRPCVRNVVPILTSSTWNGIGTDTAAPRSRGVCTTLRCW